MPKDIPVELSVARMSHHRTNAGHQKIIIIDGSVAMCDQNTCNNYTEQQCALPAKNE
jgi:hypothetical protein